jgi:hypothetical protein
MSNIVTFSVEKTGLPIKEGIYYFRGKMKLASGEHDDFEDWLQFTGTSVWMFGNEQPYNVDEFEGEWYGVDQNWLGDNL